MPNFLVSKIQQDPKTSDIAVNDQGMYIFIQSYFLLFFRITTRVCAQMEQ